MIKCDESGCTTGRRGRPIAIPAEERRCIVLKALDDLFLETRGMKQLTMSAVAKRAGMSKRTLYSIFGDRDALLLAYLEMLLPICLRPPGEDQADMPLRERLKHMLTIDEFHAGTWDLPLAIMRLAAAEGPETPELSRRCLDQGPRMVENLIRQELDRAVDRGELAPMDTALNAAILRSMVQIPILDALLDSSFRPTPAEAQARTERALEIFFGAIAAENEPALP